MCGFGGGGEVVRLYWTVDREFRVGRGAIERCSEIENFVLLRQH